MNQPHISVIVPVYNLENCIEYCVRSILQQTYKDFELILVNDGSRDNSLGVCKQLAGEDKRIRVITQENGGLSAARNTGLNHASGEWIAFIDGDDFVSPDYLEYLLKGAINEHVVMSMCGHARVYSYEDMLPKIRTKANLYPVTLCAYRLLTGHFPVSVCGCLINKKMLGDLRFQNTLRTSEDKPFEMQYLLNNEEGFVAYTNDKLYGYLVRAGSITRSSWNGSLNMIKAADLIFEMTMRTHSEWEVEARNGAMFARFATMIDIVRTEPSELGRKIYGQLKKEILDMGYPKTGSRRLRVEYGTLKCGDTAFWLLVKGYYALYNDERRFRLNEKQTRQ